MILIPGEEDDGFQQFDSLIKFEDFFEDNVANLDYDVDGLNNGTNLLSFNLYDNSNSNPSKLKSDLLFDSTVTERRHSLELDREDELNFQKEFSSKKRLIEECVPAGDCESSQNNKLQRVPSLSTPLFFPLSFSHYSICFLYMRS